MDTRKRWSRRWGLDNAATKYLDSDYYLQVTNDSSPFGNDTGADALVDFMSWRKSNGQASSAEFLENELTFWGEDFQATFELVSTLDSYKKSMDDLSLDDGVSLLLWDELVIATSVAQFMLENAIDPELLLKFERVLDRVRSERSPKPWSIEAQRSLSELILHVKEQSNP